MWPLLIAILTVQAVLSLRLVWSNTTFIDEATYLFAGHQEIMHWFHGTPVPLYPTYFSGAPVIYPPLGAFASSIGGLAAARILSLCFMLGATSLLWAVTARLLDQRSAFFAAALFAVIAPTQFLGAFATYDAMALFMMAAATWCLVAAEARDDSTLLLLTGAAVLALANATKYATALFDPAIFALVGFTVVRARGTKAALGRAGYVAAFTLGLVSALLAVGGPYYTTGVLSTTLSRAAGDNPPRLVLTDTAKWIGLIIVIGGIGVAVAVFRRRQAQPGLLLVLAATGLLAPMNQARIHTTTSLQKHIDFGVWFAAIAAGYAIAQLSKAGRRTWLQTMTAAIAAAIIIPPVEVLGQAQASGYFQEWSNFSQVVATLRTLTGSHPGHYLADDYDIPAYYLEHDITWQRWSDLWYFKYRVPETGKVLTGSAAYRAAIDRRYFSLIILNNYGGTSETYDSRIAEDLHRAGGYQVIAEAPYRNKFGVGQITIWAAQAHGIGSRSGHGRYR